MKTILFHAICIFYLKYHIHWNSPRINSALIGMYVISADSIVLIITTYMNTNVSDMWKGCLCLCLFSCWMECFIYTFILFDSLIQLQHFRKAVKQSIQTIFNMRYSKQRQMAQYMFYGILSIFFLYEYIDMANHSTIYNKPYFIMWAFLLMYGYIINRFVLIHYWNI